MHSHPVPLALGCGCFMDRCSFLSRWHFHQPRSSVSLSISTTAANWCHLIPSWSRALPALPAAGWAAQPHLPSRRTESGTALWLNLFQGDKKKEKETADSFIPWLVSYLEHVLMMYLTENLEQDSVHWLVVSLPVVFFFPRCIPSFL